MTTKQLVQYNRMVAALVTIHKLYQTPAQLKKNSQKQYGIDYVEALEMAYENIQNDAKFAVKGIKIIQPKPANP